VHACREGARVRVCVHVHVGRSILARGVGEERCMSKPSVRLSLSLFLSLSLSLSLSVSLCLSLSLYLSVLRGRGRACTNVCARRRESELHTYATTYLVLVSPTKY
jgi:hypothetical protein